MALTATQVQNLCDSLAKGCDDFNSAFILNTASNSPTYSSILSGVTGTGTSQTTGRILNFLDLSSEALLLPAMQSVNTAITAYFASIRSLAGYYQLLYPVLNALDLALPNGLNAFLTTNSIQISAYVASAFNNFCAVAVSGGYRSSAPTSIAVANYFPYAAVDDLWDITCSGATSFSVNQVGSNTSTAVAGNGIGQIYIYKVNSGNAAGGAVFLISYINSSGGTSQATYTTSAGTPAASGSLSSGYVISGCIGSAIVGISGSSMTNLEQYRFGIKLVRSPAY